MGEDLGEGAAAERPPIPTHLLPYWKGFVEISGQRQWGDGGPQPVTHAEIKSFVFGCFPYGPGQVRKLFRLTKALDRVFINHFANKRKNVRSAGEKK